MKAKAGRLGLDGSGLKAWVSLHGFNGLGLKAIDCMLGHISSVSKYSSHLIGTGSSAKRNAPFKVWCIATDCHEVSLSFMVGTGTKLALNS